MDFYIKEKKKYKNKKFLNSDDKIKLELKIRTRKSKKKKANINIYLIKIILISFIILTFLGLSIILIFKKIKIKFKVISRDKFKDFLPKINLNDDKIPTLEEIFHSNQLYINDINLTTEYITYLRPINEEEERKYNQKLYENIEPEHFWDKKRINQYSYDDYYKLSCEEKLIYSEKFEYPKNPSISVIIPSFNKEKVIMKSLRSIQNQSLKNIEIIIVDDASTDNSKVILNNLKNEDPRIRVFTHLKNKGVWRSRIDGLLYSRAKYIIHFDMADVYTDNYVLEDAYILIKKYQLDSVRFSFIKTGNFINPYLGKYYKPVFNGIDKKIRYGTRKYDVSTFSYGTIWNRLTRANIMTKGLYLLNNSYIINAYKNLWEDRLWNTIINKESFSCLMINRPGYVYLLDGKGEGSIETKIGDKIKNNKLICQFIYFWLLDLILLPKDDNKKDVINILRKFNEKNNRVSGVIVNLDYFSKKFPPYEYLLTSLIEDNYVLNEDKEFIKNLLNNYKIKTEC